MAKKVMDIKMKNIISEIILYSRFSEDEILMQMGEIFDKYEKAKVSDELSKVQSTLVAAINKQVLKLLELATKYGFDGNLWQNYLSYILITNENPFSITCEKVGASEGSVNEIAINDFNAFRTLFFYDFKEIEDALDIQIFSRITNYHAIVKKELMYNKAVSERVKELSAVLENTVNAKDFFDYVTDFYKDYGVGMFGLNKAFRIQSNLEHTNIEFLAINNMDKVMLDDLIGYEIQKKKLIDNTRAFVEGKKANNCLLFGDSGTGKSTSVKAIVNAFYKDGLRMIEIYKHQFKDLSSIIAQIKNRNYKFIIYMDDLSFEEHEVEYKFLKAVIEGGVETKPDNILIYATSNRRHLIKETWAERDDVVVDNGIHKSDTMEEKLSLVNRFGVTINYSKPSRVEFFEIVIALARRQGLDYDDEYLKAEANKWELSHGGITGRSASQFVTYLESQGE